VNDLTLVKRRLNNVLSPSSSSMPEDSRSVKIRVRSGESEAEVEAAFSDIREAIELIPEVLSKLPPQGIEARQASPRSPGETAEVQIAESAPATFNAAVETSTIPTVTIEKGDSLSDVISKFFSDSWGRSPKKLMEVREALQSYGLNYPKQSVAVALLRLAKGSKIRRFKGEGGEFVYTASTGALRVPAPMQPAGVKHAPEEESAPALEDAAEEEEQLDLDAPTAN
jgi:hypothetical protein